MVHRYGFVIPVETGIQSLDSYGFRIKCGMTCLIACLLEGLLEKTKPIWDLPE
jgi:hypothetical protein